MVAETASSGTTLYPPKRRRAAALQSVRFTEQTRRFFERVMPKVGSSSPASETSSPPGLLMSGQHSKTRLRHFSKIRPINVLSEPSDLMVRIQETRGTVLDSLVRGELYSVREVGHLLDSILLRAQNRRSLNKACTALQKFLI